jgi:hypothetical protein
VPLEHRLGERAHAASEVAEDVVVAADHELDARRVPAVGARDGEAEAVGEGLDVVPAAERLARGARDRRDDLAADLVGGERRGVRPARAPEADPLHGFALLPGPAS